jgi:hypothetical protein
MQNTETILFVWLCKQVPFFYLSINYTYNVYIHISRIFLKMSLTLMKELLCYNHVCCQLTDIFTDLAPNPDQRSRPPFSI